MVTNGVRPSNGVIARMLWPLKRVDCEILRRLERRTKHFYISTFLIKL